MASESIYDDEHTCCLVLGDSLTLPFEVTLLMGVSAGAASISVKEGDLVTPPLCSSKGRLVPSPGFWERLSEKSPKVATGSSDAAQSEHFCSGATEVVAELV